jgi:hypothetical protein
MLNGAGHQEEIRSEIWAEYTSNATLYSNILAAIVTRGSPQELLFDYEANCAHNLMMFNKIGIVTTNKKIQGKLKDHRTVCMVVAFPPNHPYRRFLHGIRFSISRKIITHLIQYSG